METSSPKDVLQGANSGYQQSDSVVPVSQAGMHRSTTKAASGHSGPACGLLLGRPTLASPDILHLPKDEGGQGLIQLGSRDHTETPHWTGRAPAYGLETGQNLVLNQLKTAGHYWATCFFIVNGLKWGTFLKKQEHRTLQRLLEEPLMHGGPSGIVPIRQLAGNRLVWDYSLCQPASTALEVHPDCRRASSAGEPRLCRTRNPFPQLSISPELDGCGRPLLARRGEELSDC